MTAARLLAPAALFCALVGGCARGGSAPGPTRWTQALVVETLTKSGLNAVPKDTVRHAFLSVTGTVYDLSGSELQIFIYSDEAHLKRDVSELDPVNVSPPTMMISWTAPPALYTNGNLAAILLTRDSALKQSVERALAAGSR